MAGACICIFSQTTDKISFDAEIMEMDERIAPDAKRLIGNVVFHHEGSVLYCDSAYYYSERNALDAFSNVYLNRGDTLHLWSDTMKYDGNTRMSNARSRVKLIDRESVLYTQMLDFDMNTNIGYYPNRGKLINSDDTLTSIRGYYYENDDLFYFRDSVVIRTPDYKIYSDTMQYNTVSRISYFFGPTHIISDSNHIYCERGWYNTLTDISSITRNAWIESKGQLMMADSLYYERNNGFGEGFRHVHLIDTVKNVILRGQYGQYLELEKRGFITDSGYMIQIDEDAADSLFIHGDTLRSDPDTGEYKIFRVYHRVKIFKSDLQGKCDSLVYKTADSVMSFFYEPILWSEENQLTADFIQLYTGQNRIDSIKFYQNSFIISQHDTLHYNQIKGRNMVGYFKDNELDRIFVKGNGETIYFPEDEGEIIGVNKATSTDVNIYLKDKEIKKIYFILEPDATFYPPGQLAASELKLKGFRWLDYYRPKTKEEIFIWERPHTVADEPQKKKKGRKGKS